MWPALRAAALMGIIVFGLKLVVTDFVTQHALRLLLLVAAGMVSYAVFAWSELKWLRQDWLHRDDSAPI